MCTVLFMPAKNGIYFASLRDEDPMRPKAAPPELKVHQPMEYIAPADALAGGTWIGINALGYVIILLNGGFEKHATGGKYKKSRGVIVNELLQSAMPIAEWMLMDMEHVEPYTLVVWADQNLFQLVWDGNKKYKLRLPSDEACIWSSSTLYDTIAKANRAKFFQNWMTTESVISKQSVLSFFKSVIDTENGFIINRNEKIKTLSYSFVTWTIDEAATITYTDMQTDEVNRTGIHFKKSAAACLL